MTILISLFITFSSNFEILAQFLFSTVVCLLLYVTGKGSQWRTQEQKRRSNFHIKGHRSVGKYPALPSWPASPGNLPRTTCRYRLYRDTPGLHLSFFLFAGTVRDHEIHFKENKYVTGTTVTKEPFINYHVIYFVFVCIFFLAYTTEQERLKHRNVPLTKIEVQSVPRG